ncbi:MAG: FliM/FliN family flagellar motor switch protein [Deltaproteobacteria bacterium]|nr:FliM/FliN family flagellar motor switch protein [Deltaproteobacteria bacterium]
MNSPILTPEELDAIRKESKSSPQGPDRIDLAGGARGLRNHLAYFERRLALFAEEATGVLGSFLRGQLELAADPVELVGPSEAMSSLGRCGALIGLHTSKGPLAGILGLAPGLASAIVERMFGGAGKLGVEVKRTKLSPLEAMTLEPFVRRLVEGLSSALVPGGADKLVERWVPVAVSPEVPADLEMTILSQLRVLVSDRDSHHALTLALFPNVLELVRRSHTPPTSTRWIVDHLLESSVQVSAVLGTAEVLLEDVLSLCAGDLIRLDAPAPGAALVLVEGAPKFYGRPVDAEGAVGLALVSEVL